MIILGTNSIKDTGYDVDNSLRFDDGSSDSLTRTPSGDGDRQKWTTSQWIKRGNFTGQHQNVFTCGTYSESINIRDDDKVYVQVSNNNTTAVGIMTNRVIRDPSAWYHIVVACDTTQGTASNRLKLYINGVEETSFSQDQRSSITQNMSTAICGQFEHRFGKDEGTSNYYNGYLAEAVLIDGQALTPTSFGEFDEDSGIWKPIDVSGLTFGTNGFYLDFEDSSALGNDAAGSNNFTVNNLTAIDQSTDTCTNNFATLNPLEPSPNAITFSEGNLVEVGSGGNGGRFVGGTIAVSSGKWWCEIKVTVNGSYPIIGIIDSRSYFKMQSDYFVEGSQTAQNRSGYAAFTNADVYNNGDNNFGSWETYGNGDIIGLGIDMDAGTPTFTLQKNGGDEKTFTAEVPPSGFYTFPAIGGYYASAKAEVNFGNPPYAISSGNTDGEGFGNFEFAVKSGYFALCTKNLAEYG